MRYALNDQQCQNVELSSRREWLLTNGIGGFSMGTACGINTRRYHGHLVAATRPPTERTVLLAQIDATIQGEGNPVGISSNQYPDAIFPEGYQYQQGFAVTGVAATWSFRASGLEVEKSIFMHPGVNAVSVRYENKGKKPFLLTLRPLVSHKFYHANFVEHAGYPQSLQFPKDATLIADSGVTLHLLHPGAQRIPVEGWYFRFEHAREAERGLDPRDDLFCPCELKYEMLPGESIIVVASDRPGVAPMSAPATSDTAEFRLTPMLKQAAEAFFVRTDERSSIIAGYPWFTDWGRDTMISIPGLCLHTGRAAEARKILSDYASQCEKGLIPNRFVESGEHPDTNTVDATLWFANAIYKTLLAEWDEPFAWRMMATLESVYDWHEQGTLFGIKVDPSDGLLTQGQDGVQLTWMDAKVGDWVVTPRHGKPVEINALWINALRVMEWLSTKLGEKSAADLRHPASIYRLAAEKAESNFESKFWHENRGHYLDTADPDDASLRPNQVIAMSLPFVKFDADHAKRALAIISRELVTPCGLRTLGPEEPGYKGRYKGSLPELDAAYHQGTAWPWLLGPYATALVKYSNDRPEAKRVLKEAKQMLASYGLGGVAEVYDGDEPQDPAGCPYQAWSVAEILRAWIEDVGGD
jgi:glycogen debranching enzyme